MPALFYFAKDDPVIGTNSVPFEDIKANPWIVLATTEYGSHLCCLESFFSNKMWMVDLAVQFFQGISKATR